MKKNETKAFLSALSSVNKKKIREKRGIYKLQTIINDYRVEHSIKSFIRSDKRHVQLTEFLYFTFLLSPLINDMEIFTIMDEYFLGTEKNKEFEQFSKVVNTLNNLILNEDIEKVYINKAASPFISRKRRKRYEQLINIKRVNDYAASYELFTSFLIILVRVNELNNYSSKYLSMEAVFKLTAHNRISQLTKKKNEIDWSPILKYINPQLRNVSQHFDISYNVESDVFIGKDGKGKSFEITNEEFKNQYLIPIKEVVFAMVAVIFLLNISWLDKEKSKKYVKIYLDAWYQNDKNSFNNYVCNLTISSVLNSNKFKNMPLEFTRNLRKEDFKLIKEQIGSSYGKNSFTSR